MCSSFCVISHLRFGTVHTSTALTGVRYVCAVPCRYFTLRMRTICSRREGERFPVQVRNSGQQDDWIGCQGWRERRERPGHAL